MVGVQTAWKRSVCREVWEEKLEHNVGSTSEETDSSISDGRTRMSFGFGSGMNLCFFPPKKLKSDKRRFKIGA